MREIKNKAAVKLLRSTSSNSHIKYGKDSKVISGKPPLVKRSTYPTPLTIKFSTYRPFRLTKITIKIITSVMRSGNSNVIQH